jgi:regulatory protein
MTEERKAALNDAAKALGMRPMTRKQLIRKLLDKGYGEEDALYSADRMEEMKALDDLDYARQFAQDRKARGFGEMRIRQELRNRGVDPEYIEEVLGDTDNADSTDVIESFIRSRLRGRVMDRREAKKISDALARKGFMWEDISPILQRFLEED